ncbi:probable serine/threonine-protein kinase [Tanacetum coccineum]
MGPKKNRRQSIPTPQPIAPIEHVVPPEPIYPRPHISYNIHTGDFGQLTTGVKDLLLNPDTPFEVVGGVEYLVIRLEVGEADEEGLLVLMRRSDLYLLGFAVRGRGIYLFDECDKIEGFTRIPFGHAYPSLATDTFSVWSVCTNLLTFKAAIRKLLAFICEGQPVSQSWKPEILKICVFLGEAGRNIAVYNNVTTTSIPLPVSEWSRYQFNVWDKISEVAFKYDGTDFDVLTREEMDLVNGVFKEGDDVKSHYKKLLDSPRACNAIILIKCCYLEVELHQRNITEIIRGARNGMRLDRERTQGEFIDVGTMISPTVYARRSLCHLMCDQPDAALRDAMQAQCVYPDWSTAFYMQAVALAKLDMHKDAVDMLNEAATLEGKKRAK